MCFTGYGKLNNSLCMIITYMQIIMLASHQLPRDRKEERRYLYIDATERLLDRRAPGLPLGIQTQHPSRRDLPLGVSRGGQWGRHSGPNPIDCAEGHSFLRKNGEGALRRMSRYIRERKKGEGGSWLATKGE